MTVPPQGPTPWARPGEYEAARASGYPGAGQPPQGAPRGADPAGRMPPARRDPRAGAAEAVRPGVPTGPDPRRVAPPVARPAQALPPRTAPGAAGPRQAIPTTSTGAGGRPGTAPAWPGSTGAGGSGPSATARPGGAATAGGAVLGDEQLAGAARAAAKHAANRIIDTSSGQADGLNKCPRCGSTDIHYSITAHALTCSYCRHQWNEENAEVKFRLNSSIADLQGHTLASGTQDVREDLTVVTLKCQGCGAEVVINVEQELQARCHWCRQTLSINSQIPNGAIPDAVLPFRLTREQAIERIDEFVGSRRTFADARFKREFVPDNVLGVYIPYMVVDGNMHAELHGTGEVTTRRYTVRRKVGDNYVTETYYDADVYAVQRGFDLLVDDLAVESAQRFDAKDNRQATNNVLNAVQPYDTDQAVAYNSNYLKGFTSERRDLNVRDIDDRVEENFLAIARAKVQPTVAKFDRGVRWEGEGVAVRGTRWVSVYVPVWLYSYYDRADGKDGMVHYIAVNGRNGNTMGSVPVSHPKIAAVSCAAGAIATVLALGVAFAMVFAG